MNHEEKVLQVCKQVKLRAELSQPVKIQKSVVSHFVPNPYDTREKLPKIDIKSLNEIIEMSEKKFKENAEFGVSIENPLKDFFNPFDSSGVDFQRDGDFIGRLKMRHRKGHIQFAAVSRLISFTNVFGNKDFKGGFGAMISGTHAIYEKGKFLYNGLGGKGISRYIGGLEGKGQDAYPNAEGSFDLIPVIAATFAYEQLWTDQLVSTIIFGFTNLFTTESQPDEQFDNNQYISVNTFYNILSNLQIGFEFSWGDRQNKDGNTQDASRLQLMAKFDF